jgi:hypothetical protein
LPSDPQRVIVAVWTRLHLGGDDSSGIDTFSTGHPSRFERVSLTPETGVLGGFGRFSAVNGKRWKPLFLPCFPVFLAFSGVWGLLFWQSENETPTKHAFS